MEQPSWTEGRLDDLNKRVDEGIGRLDEERRELRGEIKDEFRSVRREMKEGFEKVDKRFEKVDAEFTAVRKEIKDGFDGVGERFDRLSWRLITAGSGTAVAIFGIARLLG